MKKKNNINWSKHKMTKPSVNKMVLKQALLGAVILSVLMTVTGLLPSIYVTLDEGRYITLGENSEGNTEWIAAGSEENYLSGRFFKIDGDSHTSGQPASDFEVVPAGFPISCAFAEEWYKGEVGVYAFNIYMFLIDFVFWFLLSAAAIVYMFPKVKAKATKKKAIKA